MPSPSSKRWTLRICLLAVLGGCHKQPMPTGPSLAPTHNIYLRNSFDTDPSDYLGRFLPDAATELDESSGMTLVCSQYVSWRFVDGGGVQTSEVLHTSAGTRARLGASGLVEGSVGTGQTQAVQVSYTLTGKMVSVIEDPAAFAECCKAQPDQCTNRMVGEFIQGTGAVDIELARGREAKLEARSPLSDVEGGVSVSNGVAWRRAVEFPEPVYFAFKATPTPYTQGAVRTCAGWSDALPESPDGLYLRAASGPAWTEQGARQRARAVLSDQVLAVAGITKNGDTPLPGVHEQDWCVERVDDDGSVWYEAHVLGFVREADRAEARAPAAVVEAPPAPAVEDAPEAQPAAVCADWVDTVPVSEDGVFVVGRHVLPSVTKQGARLKAVANMHLQASVATGLGSVALANGTTIAVQERDWCVSPATVAGRTLHRAYALGFVSEEEQARLRALPAPAQPAAGSVGEP